MARDTATERIWQLLRSCAPAEGSSFCGGRLEGRSRAGLLCGPQRFPDHVIDEPVVAMPAQNVLAALARDGAKFIRAGQGGTDGFDEMVALDEVVEAVDAMLEWLVAFDGRGIDERDGADEERFIMAVAIPAEALGRPDEMGGGAAAEKFLAAERPVGKVDAKSEPAQLFQLGKALGADGGGMAAAGEKEIGRFGFGKGEIFVERFGEAERERTNFLQVIAEARLAGDVDHVLVFGGSEEEEVPVVLRQFAHEEAGAEPQQGKILGRKNGRVLAVIDEDGDARPAEQKGQQREAERMETAKKPPDELGKIARPAAVGAPKRERIDRASDEVVMAAGNQAAQAKERLESEAPVLITARAAADIEEIDFVRAPDGLEEILIAKFQDAHVLFLKETGQKAIAKGTGGQQCPGMRKLMQSLARRLLPSAHLEITLPTGIHVPIGSRDQISRFEEIFLARTYDDLLDRIPLPATLCDLGCNAGYFPLALEHRKRLQKSAMATRYLCIDANPDCVKIARRSLSRNLPAGAWRVVQGCVGEPGEEMRFHLSKADAHSSVFAKYSYLRTVRMKALDLTSLFREMFPDGIDLLKVDIEGAEKFLVMSWGDALRCRRIMVEYHPFCGLTAAEFSARLKLLGFEAELFQPELNSEQLGLFARRE